MDQRLAEFRTFTVGHNLAIPVVGLSSLTVLVNGINSNRLGGEHELANSFKSVHNLSGIDSRARALKRPRYCLLSNERNNHDVVRNGEQTTHSLCQSFLLGIRLLLFSREMALELEKQFVDFDRLTTSIRKCRSLQVFVSVACQRFNKAKSFFWWLPRRARPFIRTRIAERIILFCICSPSARRARISQARGGLNRSRWQGGLHACGRAGSSRVGMEANRGSLRGRLRASAFLPGVCVTQVQEC